jgi:hypothetical protein
VAGAARCERLAVASVVVAASSITCRETARPLIFTRSDLAWPRGNYFPNRSSREQNLRVAKPWKCRLRLHDWDYRENPETHEYYQVCLRCNAYKERGRSQNAGWWGAGGGGGG